MTLTATAASALLSKIVHPLEPREFEERYLGRHPVETRPTLDVFWQLLEIRELVDLELAVHLPDCPAYAWRAPDCLPRRCEVSGGEALREYSEGASLYVPNMDRRVPRLSRLCAQLARDLGIPVGCVSAQLFASRAGGGVSVHFDHDENFNLQLRGDKTWLIGDRPQELHPLKGSFGRPSERLPRNLQEVIASGTEMTESLATPGVLNYVPAGFWHATECRGDSLAISFAVAPPRAGELLARDLLRAALLAAPARRYVYGANRQAARDEAFRELRSLVESEALGTEGYGSGHLEAGREFAVVHRWIDVARDAWEVVACGDRWVHVRLGSKLLRVERAWRAALEDLLRVDGDWPSLPELARRLSCDLGQLIGLVQALESAELIEVVSPHEPTPSPR